MKKLFAILAVLIFAACTSSKPMNMELFNDVAIGTSVSDLKKQCGDPIDIEHHSNEDEYIYVERLTLGNCRVVENYYSFFVKDDKVVRKSIRTQKPPAFNLIYTEDPNNPCL
jgi:hypothetical protein